MTEWRTIPSFPLYEASDEGEIRYRGSNRLRKFTIAHGYAHFTVNVGRKRNRLVRVNRAVCEAFHGAPDDPGLQAEHLDGNRLNNRPANLRWATQSENFQRKHEHGTMPVGENHNQAKISEADVLAIRARYRLGLGAELAKEFGITTQNIWYIVNRKIWRHI